MTIKCSVALPYSAACPDPGIFVRGGGGGGPRQTDKKSSDNVLYFYFF